LSIKEEVTHPTYLDLLTESFINGLRDEIFQMNVVAYTGRGNYDLELAITACKELESRRKANRKSKYDSPNTEDLDSDTDFDSEEETNSDSSDDEQS
jgi:hypothetical protein